MKSIIYLLIAMTVISGCSSKKKREEQVLKAEHIETSLSKEESVGDGSSVGVDGKNNVIYQDVTQLTEYLHNIKYDVFKEYDELYGDRETGKRGYIGAVDDCRKKANSKKYGGDGTAVRPMERSTLDEAFWAEYKTFNNKVSSSDSNAVVNVGYNEKGQLTAMTRENLLETIERFQDYRKLLTEKRQGLEKAMSICESVMSGKEG